MIFEDRCPVCNQVLYRRNEGYVCKNYKCRLYFKLGRGWVLFGIKTPAEEIINELWNRDSFLIYKKRWAEMKQWILKRDNYKCKFCEYNLSKDFYSSGCLHVHHIIPASKEMAIYFDEDNLITVCEECHKRLHGADKHKYMH